MNGKVLFGEWLPDLPIYENPGLTEAKNCVPVERNYSQFLELSARSDALSSTPLGACATITEGGDPEVYAGTGTKLLQLAGTSWTNRSGATYSAPSTGYWRFAQFDNLVLAVNGSDEMQGRTMGSASNFSMLSSAAPVATTIGIVNRFVMLGNTDSVQHRVQWSGIDDPDNWPTPGSSTARSVQSGAQELNSAFGAVTGIAGGQFYGLIFQERGITRATYTGGDIVFQFEEIEQSRGNWCPQALVQVGRRSYFIAHDGFYMTDGIEVVPIGYGKFDRWFLSRVDMNNRQKITSAVDYQNKIIYWSFPSTGAEGSPNQILTYNFITNRATWNEQYTDLLFNSLTAGYTLEQLDDLFVSLEDVPVSLDSLHWVGGVPLVNAFQDDRLAAFTGEPLNTRLETGEHELGDGGLTFINGVRPLITGGPSSVSVGLSARQFQDSEDRIFSAQVTRTLRTGVCDFRTQGRYISARIDIQGGFDRAIGLQFDGMQGDAF